MLVGIVGWRGMVGSVLIQRMLQEGDFNFFETRFFSTSNAGDKVPEKIKFKGSHILADGFDESALADCDVILTCQGSEYSRKMFPTLRSKGWSGFWIDASREFRMEEETTIVLDPLNRSSIDSAVKTGRKVFCGGNCTVSCLLMAIHGLVKNNLVECVSSTTYQAASGGGAKHMKELLTQTGKIYNRVDSLLSQDSSNILDIDSKVLDTQKNFSGNEMHCFKVPLAGSLIPWIDQDRNDGWSLEEWKGDVELNKILGSDKKEKVKVDFTCVRVGVMRCHSQSVILKLKQKLDIEDVEKILDEANPWVEVVPNKKADSEQFLSPLYASGTLKIPIGRVRRMNYDDSCISAFTIGDQLLWGAAEPLRRMLRIIVDENFPKDV